MIPAERALLIERRKARQRAKAVAGAIRHRKILAARETYHAAICSAWDDYGRAIAPYEQAVRGAA